jgi:hypothetical protein
LRIHERSKAVKGLSKTKISKLLRIEDDSFTVVYIPTEANCPVGVSASVIHEPSVFHKLIVGRRFSVTAFLNSKKVRLARTLKSQ